MLRWVTVLAALLAPGTAAAHSGAWIGPNELPFAWTLDPWVVGPLALAWWLYGRGLARLWGRAGTGRGVAVWRAGCFAAGMVTLVLALVWPLDALGGTLFAAHMAQHMALLVVAPPLLLLGRPLAATAAGLPRSWRGPVAAGLRWTPLRAACGWLVRPVPALAVNALVLWCWHAPAAFNAAVADDLIHAAEHAAFLVAGFAFWWAVLHPARADPMAPVAIALAALVTLIHSGLLGALIALSPVPLYDVYAGRGAAWGMTQLEDQAMAGLIMWIPAGFGYLGAGLWLLGRWLSGLDGTKNGPARGPTAAG